MEYPKRGAFFASRFCRILQKSCAAQEIGRDACLLLVFIAQTEDAARYAGPVRFWNSQLLETMGYRSPKQLVTDRQRAIDHGWLEYWRNDNRSVGYYFVTIPERFRDVTDSPMEEPIRSAGGTNNGTNSGTNVGSNVVRMLPECGVECGSNVGSYSIPTPIPTPGPPPPPQEADDEEEDEKAPGVKSVKAFRQELSAAWNATASELHLSRVVAFSDQRRSALRARLRDPFWREHWRDALNAIRDCPFLLGQGERGWVIDFDFFLRPNTASAILEGKYNRKSPKAAAKSKVQDVAERMQRIIAGENQ